MPCAFAHSNARTTFSEFPLVLIPSRTSPGREDPVRVEPEHGELTPQRLQGGAHGALAVRLAEDREVASAAGAAQLAALGAELAGSRVEHVDGRTLYHEGVHELLRLVRLV